MRITKRILSRLLIVIITFILLNTSYLILSNQNDKTFVSTKVFASEIEKINIIEKLQNDYNNKDVVALLNVSNIIEEPVVKSNDNNYYLNHNINKEEDKYGTTYMDYRIDLDTSKKILIFGHSSSYRETAFGKLERYYEKDFYEKNKYIKLTTSKDERTYKIFSVYIETSDWTYMNLKFNSEKDWKDHLEKIKDKSIYDTNIELKDDDEIIILQTCSTKEEYKKYKRKYLIVAAKREK